MSSTTLAAKRQITHIDGNPLNNELSNLRVTKRTRTAKLDTGIDAEIAAAEAKLKSLREQKKEAERKFLEKNQKAISALLSQYALDRVPVETWQGLITAVRDVLLDASPKEVSAEPAKLEECLNQTEQEAA